MLLSLEEVKAKINSGKSLAVAGDENLLLQLPKGTWIGGSIPYFMAENGGITTNEKIYVTELKDYMFDVKIKLYGINELEQIPADSPENGFSILIVPATSEVHLKYAQEAPEYPGLFMKQLIGWVSGVNLNDLGKISPKVFDGTTGTASENQIVVLHAAIPENKSASVGIINIFKQGEGDAILFPQNGFSATDCLVNGVKTNLADYLINNKVDLKYPLVADYFGTNVNVSFQSVDEQNKTVNFYAPVFSDIQYRVANPVDNYVKAFEEMIKINEENIFFSCNCILNYLYSELEGKKTSDFTGPITFGEIAFQLLNQTLVYLNIVDKK